MCLIASHVWATFCIVERNKWKKCTNSRKRLFRDRVSAGGPRALLPTRHPHQAALFSCFTSCLSLKMTVFTIVDNLILINIRFVRNLFTKLECIMSHSLIIIAFRCRKKIKLKKKKYLCFSTGCPFTVCYKLFPNRSISFSFVCPWSDC